MKKNKKLGSQIFLIFITLFALIAGYSMFNVYLHNHTYYDWMMTIYIKGKGITPQFKILFFAIINALIPVIYLIVSTKNKKLNLKNLIIFLFIGLVSFSLIHTRLKGGEINSMRLFLSVINISILFGLGIYFIIGTLALGNFISQKIIKFNRQRIQEMFFEFGIGLGIILIIINFLIVFGIFYPILTRIIFLSLGFFIYKQKSSLIVYKSMIEEILNTITLSNKTIGIITTILILLSVMYYYYGFNLSFIPYSTAWDANHSYMYCPKVYSENHGAWFGGPCPTSPMLRYAYIGLWFSLFLPFKSGLAAFTPSTVAVSMNFLSGIFVLIFGLGLVKQVSTFFTKKNEENIINKKITILGRIGLLLRLTSGMGAFLVFVDNKTDLGVMSLTLLALLSGFIFLSLLYNTKETKKLIGPFDKEISKYVIISGLFFVLAHMAKMSAFQDIVLFALFLIGLRFGGIFVISIGILILGIIGQKGVLASSLFIPKAHSLKYILTGGLLTIFGSIKLFIKKTRGYVKYLILRGITVVAGLILLKGPQVIYTQYMRGNLNPEDILNGLLMGFSQNKVYAMEEQKNNYINPKYLQEHRKDLAIYCSDTKNNTTGQKTNTIGYYKCLRTTYETGTLFSGLQEPHGGGLNEDLQRYIGFGQRKLTNPKNLPTQNGFFNNLWNKYSDYIRYTPIHLIFNKEGCYGRNKDAKLFCEYQNDIKNLNIQKLEELYQKLPNNSDGKLILGCNLSKIKNGSKNLNEAEKKAIYKDIIQALDGFWKERAIYVDKNQNIYIPYRYIVPLNVSVTNKLQNLSSYYTDIGFIRFMLLCITVFGSIYLLFFTKIDLKKKKINNKYNFVFILHLTTLIGRAIRRTIASGIVRYAVGLITWTILSVLGLLVVLYNEIKNNKKCQIRYFGLLTIIGIRISIQFLLNFVRISTQGGGGIFAQYKGNTMNTKKMIFEDGEFKEKQKVSFMDWKKIFDLQFGHYNEFLETIDQKRKNDEGVLIAGTYLQYFLKNQKNIISDGLLTKLRKRMSDYNLCKFYKRLKYKKIKYIVIDPNIMSIIMGAGNSSLKERMFAKINPISGITEQDGVMTMLSQMIDKGYMKIVYSNNLAALYAYTYSQEDFENILNEIGTGSILYKELYPLVENDFKQFQAKMALIRYFPKLYPYMADLIARILQQRIANGEFIKDLSYMYGKVVDYQKVLKYAKYLISKYPNPALDNEINKELNEGEKSVLAYYINIVKILQSGNGQLIRETITNILKSGIGGQSLLIVFEVK